MSRTTCVRINLLKKNGIDVLLLAISKSINGVVKDITCGSFARECNLSFPSALNGINYAQDAGLIKWIGDDLHLVSEDEMYKKGKSGYVKIHDVFADDIFIKNISLVPKRFAIKLLCHGIGYCNHRLAKIGLQFKTQTLMNWIGVDRPHEVTKTLLALKPFFIISYDENKKIYTIKVRPKYLAKEPVNFKYSYKDLYSCLKSNGFFVSSFSEKKDLLSLLKKYGIECFNKALEEAKYSWSNIKSKAAYINVLICEPCV